VAVVDIPTDLEIHPPRNAARLGHIDSVVTLRVLEDGQDLRRDFDRVSSRSLGLDCFSFGLCERGAVPSNFVFISQIFLAPPHPIKGETQVDGPRLKEIPGISGSRHFDLGEARFGASIKRRRELEDVESEWYISVSIDHVHFCVMARLPFWQVSTSSRHLSTGKEDAGGRGAIMNVSLHVSYI
jgi:hypothetical protein